MKNYTIRFIRPWISIAILVGGLLLYFGGIVLVRKTIGVPIIFLLAWTSVCGALGYYLLKKVARKKLIVTLTAETLLIQASPSVAVQQIPLNQIASYAYHNYNENKHLIFRLHSGQKVVLRHQGALCAKDDIEVLAADFEMQRIALFSTVDASDQVIIKREKTFFEKPIANILGWIVVVSLLYLTGYLLLRGIKTGKTGSVFMMYGNGLAYLSAWWNARRARSKVWL
ncbi:hypothetical protein [uncultured Hymenobacter sp.]|uniref:hypothetical protein n=1 Tax=uncultured Hymenobacter sp. TaxID=170016 RepID=UPI0035CC0457